MNAPILTYFPLRGRAELIRLVLAEAEIPYVEHPVTEGQPPVNNRPTDFGQLKSSGMLPFQAIPVWEEPDGFRLAQSQAIVRYLSKKAGLMGAGPKEEALIDQMLGVFDDVRPELRKLMICPPGERASSRVALKDSILPRWLLNLDRQLAANEEGKGYLVGQSFTVGDLALFYLLEVMLDNGFKAQVDAFTRLTTYLERISQRPKLQAWLQSPARPRFVPPPAPPAT